MESFDIIYGLFLGKSFIVPLAVLLFFTLGYLGAPLWIWTLYFGCLLVGYMAPLYALVPFLLGAIVLNVKPLRRMVITSWILKAFRDFGLVPKISDTERTALDAGVVWVEGDLFSGKPNLKKVLSENYPSLTSEEQAFLDGPCEVVCKMVDDWEVWQRRDIPKHVFDYLKKEKFLGMIIPKKYGGLGFSALANSAVIVKLSSRCLPMATTVMVPNSLGPAELLLHYGTEDQKNRLLPLLARGEHIPCFALTEPNAGSDAGAMEAEGILFKENGELKIRLNWNKRWITLAAISTLQGIAFKLKDPEELLGQGVNLGITCALVPSERKGVELGLRHDPLGVPFYNCPTRGKDVVISMDEVVGGQAGVGKGWKMLMECLAAGRGISLPAQSVSSAKLVTRVIGAHSMIRKQFGVSIGKFEGVEEPLARIGGLTYLMEASRIFTCGSLDKGIKPPVITAIAKYYSTELSRKLINDGMDIGGGSAISRGPRNLLAHSYIGAPIAITVEGANILTRTLMIFGQGALRAHPYAYKEVAAVETNDGKAFDLALWGHMGHVVTNTFRSIVLSVTRGLFASTAYGGPLKRYQQKLVWASASFALMADVAMASLGGSLKMKEKITGRFADILSWMYLATAVLKRYEAEGSREEDLPMAEYALEYSFNEIQLAFDGIFANLKVPFMGWLFKGILRWWSRLNAIGSPVSDRVSHRVADALLKGEGRDRWTSGIYIPDSPIEALGRIELTWKQIQRSLPIEEKIRRAIKEKRLPKKKITSVLELAVKEGVITSEERETLVLCEEMRYDTIQVDEFTLDEYLNRGLTSQTPQPNGSGVVHARTVGA